METKARAAPPAGSVETMLRLRRGSAARSGGQGGGGRGLGALIIPC